MPESGGSNRESIGENNRGTKVLKWVAGVLGGLLVLLFIASFFLDEPLRKMSEKRINSKLKGYSVRLPGLHLQLVGLSVTLKGLTIIQQAHPTPPVAYFPVVDASIHWREILSGRLVAELRLDQPRLNINLQQLRAERGDETTLKEHGWQEAIQGVYPLKINLVTIRNATVTYIDQDPERPLNLGRLNFQARNIRNIHLPDKVYPSSFHLDTTIFGTGHGSIDGRANFLAKPHLGLKARFKLDKIPIDYFKPVVARSNLSIEGGVLNGTGNVEYASDLTKAHIEDMEIRGLKADYVHSAATAPAERRRAGTVKKSAREASNKEGVVLRIDRLRLTGGTFGMVNKAATVPYRVFMTDTDLRLSNLSNHFSEGPADAKLQGKFMGNGATAATATFRPEDKGPDLDLYLKIEDTQLKSMNDLLRAYGKFDVTGGVFSLITELHVKNNIVSGYLKPFFKDMKVYDQRQDKEKGAFRKMYEMLVGGVSKLLENKPREQVATKTDITGPLESPRTSTWQILVELVRNAFFKAILPNFEREVTGLKK